jgi:predicted nucleotidyltransferase
MWQDRRSLTDERSYGIIFIVGGNMELDINSLPILELEAVCRKFHIRELSLFGSAARGEMHMDSDIDFLVDFDPQAQIGFLALSRLSRELSEVMHHKVDVVPLGGLKALIREQVLAEAKVLYAA